jgi:hypothetical protein
MPVCFPSGESEKLTMNGRAFIFFITRMKGIGRGIETGKIFTGKINDQCRCGKSCGNIKDIHHQVIIMAVIINLVNTAGSFLGMITISGSIPVTGQGFMKKLPRHIAQGKYQEEEYCDKFFYGS